MGASFCCSFPQRRPKRKGLQTPASCERPVSPKHDSPPSSSPSPLALPEGLPPIVPSPFLLSPFGPSSAVPSQHPSPERRAASSLAVRRPSSTLAPSPRYFGRDASRLSSFETAPLARSSPGIGYHQDVMLAACEIWEEAYNQVRSDDALKPLVKNYETLFNTVTRDGFFDSRRSSRVQKEPPSGDDEHSDAGEECFTRLAQEYMDLARRDSASQTIVSSAVQFIQKTRDVVGLALASSPPASLAWTGICTIVLPIIVNHAEQISARESGFSYVMSRFTWYGQVLDLLNREYWKSPQSFSALRHAIYGEIVALYKLLIEYHLRAYYTYCRPLTTISRDILKLDDWNCMLSEIKESEKRLEEYMNLNYEQHLLDKLHTLSKDALHKQRLETLLKFKFPDDFPYAVYQAYLDSIDSPEDGTGAGVLTHPVFTEWATGDSGVFVLEGIPGSGKSVLSKSLLTELPKWRPSSICAFFFKDNGKGQDEATTALCRVLDQLFQGQPDLVDRICARVDHLLPEEVRCNFDLLWGVLEEATQNCEPGSVTVVLDGFDECEPDSADKLWQKLTEYLAGPSPRMKFFLTTRPLVTAPPLIFSPGVTVLKLEEDPHCLKHISKDIERVVMARFDGFALRCIQDTSLRQELLEFIRPREDRTYLYVKLLFDYLELKMKDGLPRVPRGWIDIFKKLPATVKEAYVGFLNRVRECQRGDVRNLFQIVLAAARPLTLQEVNIALNIRDLPNGSKHGLGLQDERCFRSWILDACKYFLDVYNGRVYFIHQTAKDFLLAGPGENGHRKPDWLGDFTMQACHTTLAESCILYLSLPLRVPSRFKGVPASGENGGEHHMWNDAELAFASYAHFFWRNHVVVALDTDSSSSSEELLKLLGLLRPCRRRLQGTAAPSHRTHPHRSPQRPPTLQRCNPPGRNSPSHWFTARFSPKPNRARARDNNNTLHLHDGDVLTYTLSNRTALHTASVHMLSLNASWTVGTLLWNARLPPRQQRTGELTMVLPRRVNEDDPAEAEDAIVVIFCVGVGVGVGGGAGYGLGINFW
ncbi:hypothetical protein F5144DRAFT_624215 [Chaetomium tenue]|uniref:Uncharacterized protein n=1 Tax=Chaetomium tenue TaxID=1854479 RepID=A0ACB7NXS9_9PEZI|nr:hypothetical protein F5144DRAFT_624215 [Chaetomium globosum]